MALPPEITVGMFTLLGVGLGGLLENRREGSAAVERRQREERQTRIRQWAEQAAVLKDFTVEVERAIFLLGQRAAMKSSSFEAMGLSSPSADILREIYTTYAPSLSRAVNRLSDQQLADAEAQLRALLSEAARMVGEADAGEKLEALEPRVTAAAATIWERLDHLELAALG